MRDPSSFDDFYHGCAKRVTSHIHAMVGSLAEAEDIVQDAFTKAWQHWDKISHYADPEAWVRTVAFRIQVSRWRKASNRIRAHRRHGLPADEPALSPDYVAIIAALRKINVGQRQAIVLHYLVGLSIDEIADETGVAAGTVKARLSRGRQALATHLSDLAPQIRPIATEVSNDG
ncbi:SigE family RNA polymerase sigma factor [Catenulispora yoronensis]|uniref:SigE family RNA polymerase sigma factor n=1 Tax=Catenulispora yoronensis TaxID=450799 RepID=A0ABP5FP27_9ACTN